MHQSASSAPKSSTASVPVVFAVVVSWNGWQDTIECIESLLRSQPVPDRIVICDNGSMDGSLARIGEWLCAQPTAVEARVVLIDIGTNLGYAGGNNVGIAHAMRCNADFVWILNNDVVVDATALQHMLDLLSRNPSVGAVAPAFLSYDEPDRIQALGGGHILPVFCHDTQLGRGLPSHLKRTSPIELDHLIGASILARAEAARDAGPIDESYFLYREETDWCIRMRRRGWRLCCCTKAIVWHKESRTVGFRSPVHDYYAVRNMLFLVKRFYPARLPAAFLYFACRATLPKLWRREFVRLGAVLAALRDFVSGVRGRPAAHSDAFLLEQLTVRSQNRSQNGLDRAGSERPRPHCPRSSCTERIASAKACGESAMIPPSPSERIPL